MVHKELAKINERLCKRPPLLAPSITPNTKYIENESAVAKLTKSRNKNGLSRKSPILSLLIEYR
jgi:hypothetical protein